MRRDEHSHPIVLCHQEKQKNTLLSCAFSFKTDFYRIDGSRIKVCVENEGNYTSAIVVEEERIDLMIIL